jgi:hypothetical protein
MKGETMKTYRGITIHHTRTRWEIREAIGDLRTDCLPYRFSTLRAARAFIDRNLPTDTESGAVFLESVHALLTRTMKGAENKLLAHLEKRTRARD